MHMGWNSMSLAHLHNSDSSYQSYAFRMRNNVCGSQEETCAVHMRASYQPHALYTHETWSYRSPHGSVLLGVALMHRTFLLRNSLQEKLKSVPELKSQWNVVSSRASVKRTTFIRLSFQSS